MLHIVPGDFSSPDRERRGPGPGYATAREIRSDERLTAFLSRQDHVVEAAECIVILDKLGIGQIPESKVLPPDDLSSRQWNSSNCARSHFAACSGVQADCSTGRPSVRRAAMSAAALRLAATVSEASPGRLSGRGNGMPLVLSSPTLRDSSQFLKRSVERQSSRL